MKKQLQQKYILKLNTKDLAAANWQYRINVEEALVENDERIVALGSSQCLRWIDQLNGNDDIELIAKSLKKKIRGLIRSNEAMSKTQINDLRKRLKNLLFVEDYMLLKIDKKSDYDRANKGFTVNGIKYRRFLGTSGGIKTSTIIYVSERIYPKLKQRMDNGRNMNQKLVPAKLEAYQALICSASVPVPMPKGMIVVPDCITHFKDDVLVLDINVDGDPKLEEVDGYDIEHNGSDGFGLMLPSYASKVARATQFSDQPVSGFTCRYAWTKGMLYTFDFIDFAENVAKNYIVKDVWGTERDVREAEVILTESMLKLWSAYESMEQFLEISQENDYEFAATKTTDYELDPVRDLNYQFLQSYEFTDDEIEELCKPTVDAINSVLGGDINALKIYLTNYNRVDEDVVNSAADPIIRALLANDSVINDPYLVRRVLQMTDTWCNAAKRGRIMVEGSFLPISGDPYALCESMFGLPVHGLLKSGEIYHRYWSDHGATEVVCFRAPMTCHNNIRKVKLNDSEECRYWFRYMPTVSIQNNWDTMCDAMNGSDFDGDTNFVTNNPVLLKNTHNDRTIMCIQEKAEKIVPTEKDIIKANKIGFTDAIGTITNYITSMFEVRAGFDKGSEEYKELSYRIMAGQGYQQGSIDAIKGIVTKPMPAKWHTLRQCKTDDEEETAWNRKICAFRKPYFMIYVYNASKQDYKRYINKYDQSAGMLFYHLGIKGIDDLISYDQKTEEMEAVASNFEKYMPVGMNDCTVNRIARYLEKKILPLRFSYRYGDKNFNTSIYKSGIVHEKNVNIHKLKHLIDQRTKYVKKFTNDERKISADFDRSNDLFIQLYCLKECPDIDLLVDSLIDELYSTGKGQLFVWELFGDVMIRNILRNTDRKMIVPVKDKNGGYAFKGVHYDLKEISWKGDINDCN